MKTYIEQNLTAPLNIANIAAQVHLSNSRAIHLFKETFHMTPYHYYLSRKLAIAQDLLRSTECPFRKYPTCWASRITDTSPASLSAGPA